jgi:hypothetical protein
MGMGAPTNHEGGSCSCTSNQRNQSFGVCFTQEFEEIQTIGVGAVVPIFEKKENHIPTLGSGADRTRSAKFKLRIGDARRES